jgi:hypothetical protein
MCKDLLYIMVISSRLSLDLVSSALDDVVASELGSVGAIQEVKGKSHALRQLRYKAKPHLDVAELQLITLLPYLSRCSKWPSIRQRGLHQC